MGVLINGLKVFLYYFHERGWNAISWQRSHSNLRKVQRKPSSINQKGVTIWFTGLPSSGKSTIADAVTEELRKRGLKAERLDADIIREHLWKELGYSKEDRDENIRRVAYLSHLLTSNGIAVLASFISPYRELRDYAREKIGDFIEVYVKCPVEICIERDTRGMYKKAMAGEIKNFTGISDPYEEPPNPEVFIRSDKETIKKSVARIMDKLKELRYI
jgi:adenylylsulfate kinase